MPLITPTLIKRILGLMGGRSGGGGGGRPAPDPLAGLESRRNKIFTDINGGGTFKPRSLNLPEPGKGN
jgi:hypothetical protein